MAKIKRFVLRCLSYFAVSIMQEDLYARVSAHAWFASLQLDWSHHDGWTAWPHHLSAT